MSDELGDQDFWDRQWKRRIDRYLSAQPRTGLFIRHRFGSSCNKILELGGGSCRDSAYLAQKGYQCEATDLSPDAVSYLSSKFGSQNLEFSVQDAMNLSFADDSFELVFHNAPLPESALRDSLQLRNDSSRCQPYSFLRPSLSLSGLKRLA